MDVMQLRRGLMMGMASGGAGIFEKLEVKSLTVSGIPGTGGTSLFHYSFTVSHGLGVVPDFVMLYPKQRFVPPNDTGGGDYRIIQFAIHANIGGEMINNAYTDDGFDLFTRLYTNASNSKYYQTGTQNVTRGVINTLTSQSVQIGGKETSNTGLVNGEYWVLIGKIASAYQQGEQVVWSE